MSADSSSTASGPRSTPSTGTISPGLTSSGRRPHRLDGRIGELAVLVAVDHPRRPLHQARQLLAGAGAGVDLQHLAAGEHQRHHRPGQVLAEGEGAGHRQQRDGVHPQLAPAQAGDDVERQRQQDQDDRRLPEMIGGAVKPASQATPPASRPRTVSAKATRAKRWDAHQGVGFEDGLEAAARRRSWAPL